MLESTGRMPWKWMGKMGRRFGQSTSVQTLTCKVLEHKHAIHISIDLLLWCFQIVGQMENAVFFSDQPPSPSSGIVVPIQNDLFERTFELGRSSSIRLFDGWAMSQMEKGGGSAHVLILNLQNEATLVCYLLYFYSHKYCISN